VSSSFEATSIAESETSYEIQKVVSDVSQTPRMKMKTDLIGEISKREMKMEAMI